MITKTPAPRLWIGVAIAYYAFISIGIAESGLGVLLPSILNTYQLTPATVTSLFLSQISGYCLSAIGSSLLTRWLGLAYTLEIAACCLGSALLGYALSTHWPWMIALGTLLGVGIGLIDAGVNTYIVQDPRSAHLVGSLHGCYGIGACLGPAIATTSLTLGLSWQQTYLILSVFVGLLAASILAVIIIKYAPMQSTFRNSQINSQINPQSTEPTAMKALGRSLSTFTVWIAGGLLLINVGIEASLNNWAYAVQFIARQTSEHIAGYSISIYWLGMTISRFSLGILLQVWGIAHTMRIALLTLLTGILLWGGGIHPWLSLGLTGLGLGIIFPATIWLLPHKLPAHGVPAAISFATSAASVGAAVVPTGVGWLAASAGLGHIPLFTLPLAIALGVLSHRLLRSSYAS